MSIRLQYQSVKPMTDKNIGRDHLKSGTHAAIGPGTKEAERRLKQIEKQKAATKAAKQAKRKGKAK